MEKSSTNTNKAVTAFRWLIGVGKQISFILIIVIVTIYFDITDHLTEAYLSPLDHYNVYWFASFVAILAGLALVWWLTNSFYRKFFNSKHSTLKRLILVSILICFALPRFIALIPNENESLDANKYAKVNKIVITNRWGTNGLLTFTDTRTVNDFTTYITKLNTNWAVSWDIFEGNIQAPCIALYSNDDEIDEFAIDADTIYGSCAPDTMTLRSISNQESSQLLQILGLH